ncbi:MAG TPA: hypothetical protein VFH92_13605 [Phenylobacterium sp.]|nr:hypothetical protein [Phenylobacterium sp.]
MSFGLIFFLVQLTFSVVTYLAAFVKGGSAERVGAAIILGNLIAGMANEAFLHDQMVTLAIDGITAVALLPVTLRYVSFWLGAVMILYALQFALHAYYVVMELHRDVVHVVLNNVDFFAINLCLALGVGLAWSRRRRALAAEAARPAA